MHADRQAMAAFRGIAESGSLVFGRPARGISRQRDGERTGCATHVERFAWRALRTRFRVEQFCC